MIMIVIIIDIRNLPCQRGFSTLITVIGIVTGCEVPKSAILAQIFVGSSELRRTKKINNNNQQ